MFIEGVSNSNLEENEYIYKWNPADKQWIKEAKMLERRSAFGVSAVNLDAEIFKHCETGNRVTEMTGNKSPISQEIIDQIVSIFSK